MNYQSYRSKFSTAELELVTPLIERCRQILNDNGTREHWGEWGAWLMVDPMYGLTRWPLPYEVESYVRQVALAELRGANTGEGFWRGPGQATEYTTTEIHESSCAHRAAFRAGCFMRWGAADNAARWAQQHGFNLWPFLRARLGLDVDAPACHPLLENVLASPDEPEPALVYADWLEEQGQDLEADAWRRMAELVVEAPRHSVTARGGTLGAGIQKYRRELEGHLRELRTVAPTLRETIEEVVAGEFQAIDRFVSVFRQRGREYIGRQLPSEVRESLIEALEQVDNVLLRSVYLRFRKPRIAQVVRRVDGEFEALFHNLHGMRSRSDVLRSATATSDDRLRQRLLQVLREQTRPPFHDPIEDDPLFQSVIRAARAEARRLAGRSREELSEDAALVRVLREFYAITWYPPEVICPNSGYSVPRWRRIDSPH